VTRSLLRVSGILAYVEKRTQADRARPEQSRRPRDLMISLLVLVIPVLVLVGGYQLLAGRDQPVAIDQTPQITEAQRAGFDFSGPVDLSATWVPVSAVFRPVDGGATLRLGYVTPDGEPVQLVQSTVPAAQLLARELSEVTSPSGSVDVGGVEWQRYPGRPGEQALVLQVADRTVIVVGPAAESELTELAAAVATGPVP
jgi:hypothetical protein